MNNYRVDDINELGGVITSSPFLKPNNLSAIVKASVPLLKATAYFAPHFFATFFSKLSTLHQ